MTGVVSKGTVVPRRLRSEARHFDIRQVEKGEISTEKDNESDVLVCYFIARHESKYSWLAIIARIAFIH